MSACELVNPAPYGGGEVRIVGSEGENGINLNIRCRWIKLKYFFML